MGDYSVIKRNEHLPLATTWVDLEIIMLSEMLDRKRQILSDITYMWNIVNITDVQFSSVAQSCPTLCDHMNCSTPGLPVHHQFPELSEGLILKEDILTSSEEKRVGIVSVKRGNLVK